MLELNVVSRIVYPEVNRIDQIKQELASSLLRYFTQEKSGVLKDPIVNMETADTKKTTQALKISYSVVPNQENHAINSEMIQNIRSIILDFVSISEFMITVQ